MVLVLLVYVLAFSIFLDCADTCLLSSLAGALAILFWREGQLQSNVAERADLHRKVETTV